MIATGHYSNSEVEMCMRLGIPLGMGISW